MRACVCVRECVCVCVCVCVYVCMHVYIHTGDDLRLMEAYEGVGLGSAWDEYSESLGGGGGSRSVGAEGASSQAWDRRGDVHAEREER